MLIPIWFTVTAVVVIVVGASAAVAVAAWLARQDPTSRRKRQ